MGDFHLGVHIARQFPSLGIAVTCWFRERIIPPGGLTGNYPFPKPVLFIEFLFAPFKFEEFISGQKKNPEQRSRGFG